MTPASVLSELASDVCSGLACAGQKTLPSKWFYDDVGSALFEAITLLPEYGLTRADLRLLENHSPEIAERVGTPVRVVELGSGAGKKTRVILEALNRGERLDFHPIDVSRAALDACAKELDPLANVRPVEAAYREGIAAAMLHRSPSERVLVLFLGSNVGNFEPECALALLRGLRQNLQAGDALLIGTDLLKPAEQLIPAYDDAAGVTAAFNRNILVRINRELDARFPVREFAHEARFNRDRGRMEMHLRAQREMNVAIAGLGIQIPFRSGETIWTESSYKFDLADLPRTAEKSGFRVESCWADSEWPFAESLWIAS